MIRLSKESLFVLKSKTVNAQSQWNQTPEYANEVIAKLKKRDLTDEVIAQRVGMSRRQVLNIKKTGFGTFRTQTIFEQLAGMR